MTQERTTWTAASLPPVYDVYVMSIYIRKHFKNCASKSFPEDRSQLNEQHVAATSFYNSGFRVWGLGFGVYGFGERASPGGCSCRCSPTWPQTAWMHFVLAHRIADTDGQGLVSKTQGHSNMHPKPTIWMQRVLKPYRRKKWMCIRRSGRFKGVLGH